MHDAMHVIANYGLAALSLVGVTLALAGLACCRLAGQSDRAAEKTLGDGSGPVHCHTCAGEPWCAQVEAVTGWWEHGGRWQENTCPQWRATKTEGDG